MQLHARETRQLLLAMAGIALLHVAVYFSVTRLSLLRPDTAFIHPHLGLDDGIPHLAWTWPAYWLPYALVPVAAFVSMRRLDAQAFGRLFLAWSGMLIVGGSIQVAWPALAPWPTDPGLTQQWYHGSPLILPYATLPSMHVAHVAMAALVTGTVFRTAPVRATGAVLTLAVAASTLTLKEHVLLDAVSGLALALVAWQWWRWGATC
jgi:hypothetical protein